MRLNKVNLKKQRACDLNWLKDVWELSEKKAKIVKHLHHYFVCVCVYIKWTYLASKHGKKWCRTNKA